MDDIEIYSTYFSFALWQGTLNNIHHAELNPAQNMYEVYGKD